MVLADTIPNSVKIMQINGIPEFLASFTFTFKQSKGCLLAIIDSECLLSVLFCITIKELIFIVKFSDNKIDTDYSVGLVVYGSPSS